MQVQVQRPHIQELQISQVSCASDTWTVASLSTNTLKGHASLHLIVSLSVGLSVCLLVCLLVSVSVALFVVALFGDLFDFQWVCICQYEKRRKNPSALASISGMLSANVQCCFIMWCPVNNSPAGGPRKQDKGGPHRTLAVYHF